MLTFGIPDSLELNLDSKCNSYCSFIGHTKAKHAIMMISEILRQLELDWGNELILQISSMSLLIKYVILLCFLSYSNSFTGSHITFY